MGGIILIIFLLCIGCTEISEPTEWEKIQGEWNQNRYRNVLPKNRPPEWSDERNLYREQHKCNGHTYVIIDNQICFIDTKTGRITAKLPKDINLFKSKRGGQVH